MKISILTCIIVLMATLGSCSNNDSVQPGIDEKDQTYYPLKSGYLWEYTTTQVNSPNPVKISITGTEVINSKTYYVQTSNTNVGKWYYRYENDIIYGIGTNDYGLAKDSEYVYFNFNTPTGDSVVYMGKDNNGFTQKTIVKTSEKGATFTAADGTVYKDVVIFHTYRYVELSPTDWWRTAAYQTYFAKGVGMIVIDVGSAAYLEIKNYSFK